jgi:hypothetical protein
MIVSTLDTGDVSFILRQALGRMRTNWSDFLADCIRDKASISGLTLQPIARVKLPGDRCKRPRYTAESVQVFILAVLSTVARPTASERAPERVAIEIDPAALTLPLALRSAKPATAVAVCKF